MDMMKHGAWDDGLPSHCGIYQDEEPNYFRYCYKGKGGGAPAAPDPAATAAAQGAANKEAVYESARVNQINETTPYGSLTYTGEIGDPDRTRTTTLSPEGQALFDTQQEITGTLGDYAKTRAGQLPQDQFSFDQFGDLPTMDNDYRTQVSDDMFARLNPQIDRRRTTVETQLANQGITRGSEAWNSAMDDLSREENDLRLAISGMSGDEMSRLYNMQLTGRQQGLNEYQTERAAPINELAAALQGSPAIGTPNFAPNAQYQVGAPDIAGLTLGNYNAQSQQAAAGQAASSSLFGNLIGAGGTLGAAYLLSDRSLKTGIKKIGKLRDGINIYSFRYKWSDVPMVGVIAQEVANVIPQAVKKVGEYLAVDYSKLEAA